MMGLCFEIPEDMNKMIDPKHFIIFPCIERQSETVTDIKSNTKNGNLLMSESLGFLPH